MPYIYRKADGQKILCEKSQIDILIGGGKYVKEKPSLVDEAKAAAEKAKVAKEEADRKKALADEEAKKKAEASNQLKKDASKVPGNQTQK